MKSSSTNAAGARQARAAGQGEPRLEELIRSHEESELRRAASHAGLNEDQALAMLSRRDLPGSVIEEVGRNQSVMKHRKVMAAVVRHLQTPRHVSVPLVRKLYTFELLQISLLPGISGDLRVVMEKALVDRLETITAGERLTLALRGPGGLVSALLLDSEERVIRAALENPSMTEERLVHALLKHEAPEGLVHAVCRHSKWSLRRDIRIALLLSPKTPLGHVLAIAQSLPAAVLRDLLQHAAMEPRVKQYLTAELEQR